MLPDRVAIFQTFAPELVLLGTVLFVLAGDLLARSHYSRRCMGVTVGGLVLAATSAIVFRSAGETAVGLAGLTQDSFALAVKVVGFVFTAIIALLASAEGSCKSESSALYCALLLVAALVLSILGAASDVVLILLGLDFLGIIAYIMTGYECAEPVASEAALKYLLYGGTLSALMLFGFSWLYGVTGATTLSDLGAFLRGTVVSPANSLFAADLDPVILPALIMVGAGFAAKLAVAPFHQWAPDAYQGAPTASTAFIAVIPKLAGFSVLVRFTLTAIPVSSVAQGKEWQALLLALTTTTVVIGNLAALWQTDIKRLLAYSGVAQVGYMLLAVAVETPTGIAALLFYFVVYALAMVALFAVTIAVTANMSPVDTDLAAFVGLHARAPGLAFVALVGLLALIGLPLTGGFVGKWWLIVAALEAGLPWLTVLAVLSTIVSVAYYWKVLRLMYFQPAHSSAPIRVPASLAWALIVAVVCILLLGLAPTWAMALFRSAAMSLQF